jgi:prepilin-type processing-associated H-X9-DG protein
VESPTSLLLESGIFAWCDGHVSTEGLRLRTTRKDYEMTLLCDRLRLASLLDQFGVQGAEGEGTLNGRIPISVVDGKVRFVDGFLNSPPGEGGTIRVGDVGVLTAGIPKDSPQFSQLDFAGEALKDFRYNSAKLRLNSEGDELLLQIKLDGQPSRPIPFRYNSEIGSFTRLQAGETGGITHPILLDINLRVPFQKMLEYGGGMQKLYEMTQ